MLVQAKCARESCKRSLIPKALYRLVVGMVGSWLGKGRLVGRLLAREVTLFTALSALCCPFWSHEFCTAATDSAPYSLPPHRSHC